MSAGERPEETARVRRGARRHLAALGLAALDEFSPERRLRVDLIGLARNGEIWIVEVKSGLADLKADQKWRGYLDWCDRFFFAVGPEMPLEALPAEAGVIRADAYEAAIVRAAPRVPLPSARRRALTLRIARDAAARLARREDPGAAVFDRLAGDG